MSDLSVFDSLNLRQVILETPEQFEAGLKLAKNIKVDGEFNNVTISGMGGSALPANLLRTYCNSLFKKHPHYKPFEIYINRYYSLPPESHGSESLNLIASYSGNTEETIASLSEAHSAGLKFVGFSSGGKIEALCKQYGAAHIKLPVPNPDFQPRMGTGYFFASMFQLLVNQGLIPDTTSELLALAKKLREHMDNHERQGQALASKIKGKTPVIYSSPKYKPVAMIWKIKINENAKTPAFWNFFPELNHNEMVGFTNPQGKFFILMLKDPEDDPRNLKRYEATLKLLAEKGIESEIIEMQGRDVFSKMFSCLNLADWTSYYLALEYGQDPTPVDMVEKLKKILASQ
jgi:glucose/mannose-6-phosphate isomerase